MLELKFWLRIRAAVTLNYFKYHSNHSREDKRETKDERVFLLFLIRKVWIDIAAAAALMLLMLNLIKISTENSKWKGLSANFNYDKCSLYFIWSLADPSHLFSVLRTVVLWSAMRETHEGSAWADPKYLVWFTFCWDWLVVRLVCRQLWEKTNTKSQFHISKLSEANLNLAPHSINTDW